MYRDALANSGEHQKIKDELEALKIRKKQIEEGVKSDFTSEFDKLDKIKLELESSNLILSDIALNHVMRGELIELTDMYENKYEPQFTVKFKKI
jgi:hypothetical protein